MSKMNTRIRELESELDAENHRFGDALKNLCKSERRIKELTFIKLNLLSKERLFVSSITFLWNKGRII
jgi:hypothetical protein